MFRTPLMAPKVSPKCSECQKTESLLWRCVNHKQICHECYEIRESKANAQEPADASRGGHDEKPKVSKERDFKCLTELKMLMPSTIEEKRLRKSTRATRFKAKASATTTVPQHTQTTSSSTSKAQSKGKSRRNMFKKTPHKTPKVQATTHTVESVFYKGSYMQVGDIVSLVDSENSIYYAQIRGLLIDQYCEKSAFLTWLIPTQDSPDPNEKFDAATYLIGPDEEFSRKLSYLDFVMHAPSNYYHDRTTPYPLPDTMEPESRPGGYIWTNLN